MYVDFNPLFDSLYAERSPWALAAEPGSVPGIWWFNLRCKPCGHKTLAIVHVRRPTGLLAALGLNTTPIVHNESGHLTTPRGILNDLLARHACYRNACRHTRTP